MIVSVHIPKCAGTSFRHFLETAFGEGLRLHYPDLSAPPGTLLEEFPAATRVIHGHFLADRFDARFEKIEYVTWLRHPVERLLSHYEHARRTPDMRDDCVRAVHERNLGPVEFAEMDWMRNQMSRYLAGKPLNAFKFVGIAEQFPRSLADFCARFSLPFPEFVPNVNRNPKAEGEKVMLSEADRKRICELNQVDLDLYHSAVTRLLGDSIGRPV